MASRKLGKTSLRTAKQVAYPNLHKKKGGDKQMGKSGSKIPQSSQKLANLEKQIRNIEKVRQSIIKTKSVPVRKK